MNLYWAMMSNSARRAQRWSRHRGGVTLIEIVIVISIISILAAIGGPMLTESLPRWRTRRAAMQFAAAVEQARGMAIAQNVEYRIVMEAYDSDLADATSVGRYAIAKGNASSASTAWDVLPAEALGVTTDDNTGEGRVEISDGGEDALPDVSIEAWGTLTGTAAGNDIVFSPRGWVTNPVTDFDSDGYLDLTFVNTRVLRQEGVRQTWTVRIARGGMVRVASDMAAPRTDGPSGTNQAGTVSSTSGSGYNP